MVGTIDFKLFIMFNLIRYNNLRTISLNKRMLGKQITLELRHSRAISREVLDAKSFGLHSAHNANEFIVKLCYQYIVAKEKIH